MNNQLTLPVSVKKNLDIEDIEYECILTEAATTDSSTDPDQPIALQPAPASGQRVKSILLEDSIGKIQALVSYDFILDLSYTCETLGRNLQVVNSGELENIVRALGLTTMAAIPHITNYATIVEKSLLEKPVLFLETGLPGIFAKVVSSEFKKITAGAQIIECARNIKRFLPEMKPSTCEDTMIQTAVEEFTTLRIKQRLENTLEIPPMPDTAKKIIQLRVDPDAGVGELAQVVETDPSLAAQVVSWASSPYYAAPGKITSVHDAVVRVLGFDLVINLALGLAMGKTLSLPNDNVQGTLPYWQHAVISAAACEAVVKSMPREGRPSAGLCYLAGLLHNFGFLILGHVFPPYITLINRHIEANTHVAHEVIENSLLGITREQICAWLMNAWSLPEEVVTAIKYQAFPEYQDKLHLYPNVLFVANQMVRKHQEGIDPKKQIPPELIEQLGIKLEDTQEACQSVFNQASELKTLAANLEKSA